MTTCVATLHIGYCVVSFARTVNAPFALNRSLYLRRRALNSDTGKGLVLVMDVIADRLIRLAWGSNIRTAAMVLSPPIVAPSGYLNESRSTKRFNDTREEPEVL